MHAGRAADQRHQCGGDAWGSGEFQIGPVGAPDVGDEVMVARWLLHRLGEQFGIVCTFNPKPVQGDWNGAQKFARPYLSQMTS